MVEGNRCIIFDKDTGVDYLKLGTTISCFKSEYFFI